MPPIPFTATLAIEGVETSDRRIIEPNALTWRPLPLSLSAITEDSHGGMPTTTSVNVGRIDAIMRTPAEDLAPGAQRIMATGVFDDADPVAADIARKVGENYLRGVSVDVGDVTSELEVIAEDADGWPTDWLERMTAGRLGGATVCAFPAFEACTIQLANDLALAASAAAPPVDGLFVPQRTGPAWVLLAAVSAPDDPPAAYFTDPALPGPTALTVLDDGRVFGHLGLWGDEHTGIPGATMPRSPSGYRHFHVGVTRTAEGTDLATGVLTAGAGHAATRGVSAASAQAHYDDVCTAWADVRAGEDEHGVWVAGCVRPGLDDAVLRAACRAPLSGDWRDKGQGLDLIAVLSVNTPGFAVPRLALAASAGRTLALVAAGALPLARAVHPTTVTLADISTAITRALAAERRRAALRARMLRAG